jgi:alpha-L-arabinofuranosidase
VKDVANEVATINESEVAQTIAKLIFDENWNKWHNARAE